MGAKHSCCAYSSPRTENRSKKDKNRGRESSRENDRYEPSQINNISHKVSESCGNLQHIRWIFSRKRNFILNKNIFQWKRAWWLGGWPQPPSYTYNHVHGEIQAGHYKWHEPEEIHEGSCSGWISIYRRFYDIEKGIKLFDNLYWWFHSVAAKLEKHDKMCLFSYLLPHQESE